MHPLLKPHIVCYSNDLAFLSGFHDILKNILIGYTNVLKKAKVNIKIKVQQNEKAQLGTLEIMYVQYGCNPPSSFRDLLRKRSKCQNI